MILTFEGEIYRHMLTLSLGSWGYSFVRKKICRGQGYRFEIGVLVVITVKKMLMKNRSFGILYLMNAYSRCVGLYITLNS